MKARKIMAALMAAGMVLSVAGTVMAADIPQFADGWGDTYEAFDPLTFDDAITFEEMREQLGAVPVSDEAIAIAGNIRTEDNVYWTALRDGYKDMVAFENENGLANVTIDVKSALNEADTEGQLAVMKDQIRDGAIVIMISPISTSNCTEGVEVAHDDGIPTIAVNNEFNGADMFVGPNSYEEGRQAGDWANEKVGSGKAVIIMGLAGTDVVKNRTNGFKDALTDANSEIEVVDEQNADWDRDTAKDVCATFLKTYDDLKVVFCNNGHYRTLQNEPLYTKDEAVELYKKTVRTLQEEGVMGMCQTCDRIYTERDVHAMKRSGHLCKKGRKRWNDPGSNMTS